MLFGPIFHSESLMTARRNRYYAARVLYGVALLCAMHQEVSAWELKTLIARRPASNFDPTFSFKLRAMFAETCFLRFAWVQGITLLSLIPALIAGVIADEHRRRTLTLISPRWRIASP